MRRYVHIPTLKWLLAALLFGVVLVSPYTNQLLAGASNAAAPATIVRSESELFYLDKVNSLRAERGLEPLVIDSRLSLSASQKTADMVGQGYWGHYAPSGASFSDYIWRDSPKAVRVGENLAKCFDTRAAAFDALVASPTHYAVMVGQFTNFGVSEQPDPTSGCTYTTMHFAFYN